MLIINHKKIFISISLALVALSLLSIFIFGLRPGIDFTGGALLEVEYEESRPELDAIYAEVSNLDFGNVLIQPTGERGIIIKARALSESEHQELLNALGREDSLTEVSYNSIGPSVGRELTRKAIIAIILVSLSVILFIAFVFRRVSKPVSSWRYGFIAIITLLHDIIIPTGIFAVLANFYGAELDTLFVVALLTILGLSLSDTIVIFDRIRENLADEAEKNKKTEFGLVVGKSIEQSYARSIATSLTVIIVLLALLFFGPESTKHFALMLTAGMTVGTYSSIFLASPLLVWAEELQNKK